MNGSQIQFPGSRVLGELTINDLVARSQRYLRPAFVALMTVLLAGGLAALINGGGVYLTAYVIIMIALLPPIWLWIYSVRRDIPLVPSLALVNLVWNALPLAFGNPKLLAYSDDELLRSSGEILMFGVALSSSYLLISGVPSTRPREYRGFAISKAYSRRTILGAAQAGLAYCLIMEYLIVSGQVGVWVAHMPVGTFAVIRVFQEAIKLTTGFVLGYAIGGRYITGTKQILIAATWICLFTLGLASLLLSSAAGLTIAIAAGLFLGSGRIPWKYLFAVLIVIAFFNHSKHEMRKKYWNQRVGALQLYEFPEYFTEWSFLTIEKVFGDEVTERRDKTEGLLERVSTLQMLLYVQRMVHAHQVPTLNGATYAMIPKLLVPRILWPEKPRTHEGQVLLNTHFGRQTRAETYRTYIAWGLIAESYGNFGSILGPLILGFFMGGLLTSISVWSGNYPLMSTRGSVTAAIFMEVLVSYEMSAAVLVTSTAQLLVILLGASALLSGKHQLPRAA